MPLFFFSSGFVCARGGLSLLRMVFKACFRVAPVLFCPWMRVKDSFGNFDNESIDGSWFRLFVIGMTARLPYMSIG